MSIVAQIRQKAERLFFKQVSAMLKGDPFSGISIGVKLPEISTFADLTNLLEEVIGSSKERVGNSYSVVLKKVKLFGSPQQLPVRVEFKDPYDYFSFVGREEDLQKIILARNQIIFSFPELDAWACANPLILLEYFSQWKEILVVIDYFKLNPPPHSFYLRELPISVHTKFIEVHSKILKCILDMCLPREWINFETGDFSARYFLRRPSVHTQVRVLDEEYLPIFKYGELSMTLDDLNTIDFSPEKVFIIENRACFLSFPKIKGGIAIFGGGFRARLSTEIKWLKNSSIYCWFDLDDAGFEILNMVRSQYNHAKSILMDLSTFNQFAEDYAVVSTKNEKKLPFLNPDESFVLNILKTKKRNRLEQEHITAAYVYQWLVERDFEIII